MISEVIVYSKPNCPYCVKATNLLDIYKIPYIEKKLDVHFTREQLLEQFPTAKSFPVIVVDGFFIGGYNMLETKLTEEYKSTKQLLNENE